VPAAAAPAPFATLPPAEPSRTGDTAPVVIHTVIVGGMPGGKIILIAAAALAAVAAVLPDRARATRRHMTVPGAQSVPPPPSAAAASPGQTSRSGHVVDVVVPKRQPRRRPAREGLTASREPEETPEWLI
jgi:hypothetical protein